MHPNVPGLEAALHLITSEGIGVVMLFEESNDPERVAYYNAQLDVVVKIIKDLKQYLEAISNAN